MSQELKEKGKLTEQESADTKAAQLKKDTAVRQPQAKIAVMTWRVKSFLLVMSLMLLGSIWHISRAIQSTQSRTRATPPAVILIDEVEHLPASAGKAIPLSLSYGGTVNIDIQVVSGNPIDVFLTTPDRLDTPDKPNWDNPNVYGDFGASQTKRYRRVGHLAKGGYYLVVRDMSVGMPSSLPSDISVKVQLHP